MTVREAAGRIGIGKTLCYQLIEEERLGCLRIGQRGSKKAKIIIREKDIEAFIRTCEVDAK
jgi:excisionase family DNA binding protein